MKIIKKIIGGFCLFMFIVGVILAFTELRNQKLTAAVILIMFGVPSYLLIFRKPKSSIGQKVKTEPTIDMEIMKETSKPENAPDTNKHTVDTEELSFQFMQRYADKIAEYENRIYGAVDSIDGCGKKWLKQATTQDIEAKIRKCDEAIDVFNGFQEFCYKRGAGGIAYFQEMWEHCHNSNNPDFSYIDSIIETKEYLQKYKTEQK